MHRPDDARATAQMVDVARQGLSSGQEVAVLITGWPRYMTITSIEPVGSNPLLLEILLPRGEAVYCPWANLISVWSRPIFADREHVGGPGPSSLM